MNTDIARLEQLQRRASIARSKPLSMAKRKREARALRKAWRERTAR